MSQIEIPDWVVEGACKNAWPEFRSGMETEIWEFADAARRDRLRQIVRAALRAALEGWLVPVAVSREHDSSRPSFYDVVPNDSQEADMWAYALVPLYHLRQEKPE